MPRQQIWILIEYNGPVKYMSNILVSAQLFSGIIARQTASFKGDIHTKNYFWWRVIQQLIKL